MFTSIEFPDAYRISYLASAIVIPTYEEIRREFGIVRAEYLLLGCLAHYEQLSAQDVARLTRRPRNSISRAVHRLLDDGYLDRSPDPDDGRQANLTITPAGRELHDKIAALFVQREAEILEPLSATQRRQLDSILGDLSHHAAALPR